MAVPKSSSKAELPKQYTDYLPATSAKDPEVNCIYLLTYWSTRSPSGVAISISPATKKDGIISFSLTSGLRYVAAEGLRMNRKLILTVRDRCLYEIEKKLGKGWEVLQKVLEKEQVTLTS